MKTFKIGRDPEWMDDCYMLNPHKIKHAISDQWDFHGEIQICARQFHRLLGQRLKPGEIGTFKLVRVKKK